MRDNLFRGRLTERFADAPKMRPDLVERGIIKDGFVYGSLVVGDNKCYICTSVYAWNGSYINNSDATMFEVDPETVGQYTGLTDKDGITKVFEGDILRDDDAEENGVVVFEEGEFCVVFGNVETHGIADIVHSCYVRGNAYDNPELLEG